MSDEVHVIQSLVYDPVFVKGASYIIPGEQIENLYLLSKQLLISSKVYVTYCFIKYGIIFESFYQKYLSVISRNL